MNNKILNPQVDGLSPADKKPMINSTITKFKKEKKIMSISKTIVNLEYTSKENYQEVLLKDENKINHLFYTTNESFEIPIGNKPQVIKYKEIVKLTDESIIHYKNELMYILFEQYRTEYEIYKELTNDLKYILVTHDGKTRFFGTNKAELPFFTVLNGSLAQNDFIAMSNYTKPLFFNLVYDIKIAKNESPERISQTNVLYFLDEKYDKYYNNITIIKTDSSIKKYAEENNVKIDI